MCELEQNFALGLGEQRPLTSCALHPSGYYMAVALNDQIRLYHILHPDLKQFNQYDLKNTKQIKFSSGGQYLCVIESKVHIFNTYTLERVRILQIPPNSMSTIHFNFNDSRIVFISAEGQLQNYDLGEEFNKIGELISDRLFVYKNALFLSHNDPTNNEVVVVGTQKERKCASITIFDGD